ncbi:MAG: diguanylate cyclase [Caulobacteraceae bacterium]
MIKKSSDIMEKNFTKVDVLTGVRKVQNIFQEEGIECFVAYENKRLAGIITKKELVGAHPNRIIADIMSDKYICVECCMYIWEIKEIFDLNRDIDTILVQDENGVTGYITRTTLNMELGKHTDLLTGLYKNDYLFYNAYKLIRSGEHISIMFIDMDNFGYIDKKYGHINGDAILKKVADILKENAGSESFLCRYAGDEFAIVTSYCISDSRALAEKIINSINSHAFPNDIPVSVSIGITGFTSHNKKTDNISGLINKMVNIASLSSTKAKQSVNSSIIIGDIDIDAIA